MMSPRRIKNPLLTVFSVTVFAVSIGVSWRLASNDSPTGVAEVDTNRPRQALADGYVSSNACEGCHFREYKSWWTSYHRTMTQVASPETVAASFNHVEVTAVRGRSMHLERRDQEFRATFDDPDACIGCSQITRKVALVTGSHHQQQYWYSTGQGRLVSKLPGIFLIDEKRWIPRQAAFLHPPDERAGSDTGAWNAVCIACHTTGGKPEIDSPFGSRPVHEQTFDSEVVEFGIACEACHGPGGDHAHLNQNPLRRYALHLSAAPDPSIVQPLRLDPRRSSQVCGQCHSVWEFYDVAGERQANRDGLPYRPSGELKATRFIADPTTNLHSPTMKEILATDPSFARDSFWPDGMIRVSGREYNGLIESPCFKDARDPAHAMTCFSCHAMHQNEDDPRTPQAWAAGKQLKPEKDENETCLQCHPALRRNLAAHTKHQSVAGNLCSNCHMPYTTYGLLRALRSHQVSSPSVAVSLATGRPNACNQCHLDKTLAWTSERLNEWYGIAKPALTPDERAISGAVLWLLRGDAGQRALMAWTMGWAPAQQASGVSWMAPLLSQLLNDPYEAVRFIASNALTKLPDFGRTNYDPFVPPDDRVRQVSSAFNSWQAKSRLTKHRTDPELLLDSRGDIDLRLLERLKKERNDRPMFLRE
jgi:hypothetical protein